MQSKHFEDHKISSVGFLRAAVLGAILPIGIVYVTDMKHLVLTESIFTTVLLFMMGSIAAKVGGANMLTGAIRVSFWGIIAMGFTAFVGRLFETNVF